MSVQVTLTFASIDEMQAYFVGREVIAATLKQEKSAAPKAKPPVEALKAAAPSVETPAPTATTETPAPAESPSESAAEAVDFETVKKAFLKMSTMEGGRARCESVLKPFGIAKLSEAKAEQYGEILVLIKKASA
jgi:hypothetical protein